MSTTIERQFIISAPVGLHLRPASMLSKTVARFDSTVTLCRHNTEVDADSALSVILLDAGYGETVTVTARGHDAVSTMMAIEELFQAGFRERPLSMAS
jgi:phosphocarrier protein